MSWQPIDFQSIVTLDSVIVELLESYLDEKENVLAKAVAIALLPKEEPSPTLLSRSVLTLSAVLEYFEKSDFHLLQKEKAQEVERLAQTIPVINKAVWQYLETLEGSVTELSQQLEGITLEQWHDRLPNVITDLKELLIHKIENLVWFIRRLEAQLWRFRLGSLDPNSMQYYFQRLSKLWTTVLDKNFIPTLVKNQEFLRLLYQKFTKRYQGYLKLQSEVEPHIEKLSGYKMLHFLGRSSQQQLTKLYMLLKLWELNRSSRELPNKEFNIALRNVLSVDKAIELLKNYYQALKSKLFERSLAIKQQSADILEDPSDKEAILSGLMGYQTETHFLAMMIDQYRNFLLRMDPDPYVRTRVGFSDPTAGVEPAYTKPLLGLGFDAESLSDSYAQLIEAVSKCNAAQLVQLEHLSAEIEVRLHEMGQPLTSARALRHKVELVLEKLKELDELGSIDSKVIDYSGKTLSKLMRADWRYHVSFGIPLFHYLYATHIGLVKPVSTRQHINRMAKFNYLISRFTEWVKPQNMQIHAHDLELSINDLKAYLQDFLGSIQHAISDTSLTSDREKAELFYAETAQQVLEYRYLFGNFFYHLRQDDEFGAYIRKQFLFVDQYFESIEQKLHELKTSYITPEVES